MKMSEVNLPNGWAIATVGELADYVNGRAFKPTEWKDNGKPIIRIQNLNDDQAKHNFSTINHEEKYLVKNGDLLFAWSASLGAHIWHGEDAWLNQHIFNVLPNNCTTKLFVYYLLKKITTDLYAKAHGSGMVHVTKGKFESTEILLPPLPEQRRIVAKLEELFSELDKGIESFKTAREQLNVYRQALLKHAFEGKLTAEWREENKNKLETADVLLKRIQAERAERYRQQVKEWEKAVKGWEKGGKKGSKPGKPSQPKQLLPLTAKELAELPQLPKGWGWVKLGNTDVKISDGPFGSNLKTSDYVDSGVRVVRLENIGVLEFIENKETYITEEKYELLKRHAVTAGDIIFSSFILENIRITLIPPSITKAINKADCFCVRLSGENLNNAYAVMFLSSRHVYKQLEALVHGIGRPRINTTQLKNVIIPVCCIEEQTAIVTELDSRLSEVDQLDQTITTALQQSETLRQSILKKAFAGQLVPQDPNDEPASKLLERIKAERDKLNNGDKGKKRTITRKKKTGKV